MRLLPKGSKFFNTPWRLGRAFIAGGVLFAIGLIALLSQLTSGKTGGNRYTIADANKDIDNALDRLFSTPVAYADAVGRSGSNDGCWSSSSSGSSATGDSGSAGGDSGGSA